MIRSLTDIWFLCLNLSDELYSLLSSGLGSFILAHDKRQVCLLHVELGSHDIVVLCELFFKFFGHIYDLLAAGEGFSIPSNL